MYLWVQRGVLPDADVRRGNYIRWVESKLAAWERTHLRLLATQGVDVDRLPASWSAMAARQQDGRAAPRQSTRGLSPRESAVEAFAVVASIRGTLMKAMAANRGLRRYERADETT